MNLFFFKLIEGVAVSYDFLESFSARILLLRLEDCILELIYDSKSLKTVFRTRLDSFISATRIRFMKRIRVAKN